MATTKTTSKTTVWTNDTDKNYSSGLFDSNKYDVKTYDPKTSKVGSGDIVLGGPSAIGGIPDSALNGAERISGADRGGTYSAAVDYLGLNKSPKVISTGGVTSDSVFDEGLITRMLGNLDASGQARLAQMQRAREGIIEGYNRDAEKAKPEYQALRNRTNYQSAKDTKATKEMNAANGVYSSGYNVTDMVRLQTENQGNLADIDRQERQMLDDVNFKIKELQENGVKEDDVVLKDLQTQKDQLELSILDRIQAQNNFNAQLQMQNQQFNYGVYRDQQEDTKYYDATNYDRNRDTVLDNRWKTEFDYQKQMDEWDRAWKEKVYNDSKSGSGSGSSGSGTPGSSGTKEEIQSYAYNEFMGALEQGKGEAWLTTMKNQIIGNSALGIKIYDDMKKRVDEWKKAHFREIVVDPLFK